MISPRFLPCFDERKLDADGLPHLGIGERFFHASFELSFEDSFVEGVVAAIDGSAACSSLLAADAHCRIMPYDELRGHARYPLTRQLTRDEARELAPRVAHRVSMWKAAPAPTEFEVREAGVLL